MKNLVIMERDATYPMIAKLLNVTSIDMLRERLLKVLSAAFDSENIFLPALPDIFDGSYEWEIEVSIPEQGVRVLDIYQTYLY